MLRGRQGWKQTVNPSSADIDSSGRRHWSIGLAEQPSNAMLVITGQPPCEIN
jgi:hypothetical protein